MNNVANGSIILLEVGFFVFVVFAVSASPAIGPALRGTSMEGLGIESWLLWCDAKNETGGCQQLRSFTI